MDKNEKLAAEDQALATEVPDRHARKKLGSIGTIFASGSAMFSDGYANASLGPARTMLEKLYPDVMGSHQNKELVGAMGFAGMVVGQLFFGWFSDKIGRRLGMFICTGMIFLFSLLSAFAAGPPQTLISLIIAWRFLNGIGIGGEYPCGSVTAAEATENHNVRKRWQQRLFIWATNSMLDLAFSVAWFVALVILWIFGESRKGYHAVWRGTLGLGIIPPIILTIARIFMVEPEAYKKNSMRHTRIPYWLIIKRYWVKLTAISIIWFIYDWITYPFGMYASDITSTAQADPNNLYQTLGWSCLVNFFYLPGSIIGSFVSDWIGPKYAMITGFLCQAIFGFALSGAYNQLVPGHIAGFAIMYGIFLAFGELGPGNNLGLLASKAIGPTAARGQLYGIAAAIGKVGAFIGSYTFPQITDAMEARSEYLGHTGIFYIGSSLAVFAAILTAIFVPNIKPDYMINEDIAFREYLAANGYDISQIGEPEAREKGEIRHEEQAGTY